MSNAFLEEVVPRVNVVVQQFNKNTGELLHTQKTHNLVVDAGLNLIRDALRTGACSPLTQFAIGRSGAAVSSTQTTLQDEILKANLTNPITSSSKQLIAFYHLTSTVGNDETIREVGLFTQNNTMYARVVLPVPIVKINGVEATFAWTLTWGAS